MFTMFTPEVMLGAGIVLAIIFGKDLEKKINNRNGK